MRRVRAEPRPAAPSRWRPAAVLAAAAIAIIAAVLGISRLDTGTSSSGSEANGGGSAALGAAPSVTRSSSGAGAEKPAHVYKSVSPTALRGAFSVILPPCSTRYTLHVPQAQLDTAARHVQSLARTENGITVRVAGDATTGRHLTCP